MVVTFGLFLLILSVNGRSTSDSVCPDECICLGNVVKCKNLQLVGAPGGLPSWTESLILEGNRFATLKFTELLHLPKLQELNVNSNKLQDNFTLSLSQQCQLKRLKINKNQLTVVPNLSLSTLLHLSLSHNSISSIDGNALLNYPLLQYLDLSGNIIKTIKYGSFLAPNQLKILNLNSNEVSYIEPKSFENLTSLSDLRLNKDRLTQLQDFFTNLNKLKVLELDRNELAPKIHALSLIELESLEELRLRRNKIEVLGDGAFWHLKNLSALFLDFNSISHIKEGSLFGLEHLQLFTLSHNQINTIDPHAWQKCQEIIELDLSHNELTSIDRYTFASLKNLHKLQLDYNSIAVIEDGAFDDLINLQILELNANRISYIVEDTINGTFMPLGQLMKLGLASNQIKSISKNAFNGLSKVTELDLTDNNITNIQENAFIGMTSLTKLKTNTSNLYCDCGLHWLGDWLRNNRYTDLRIICGHPHWLRGISLMNLDSANFTCDQLPIPRIIEEPLSQLSIKGKNVTLTCRATSTLDTPLSFKWKHDNVEIDKSNTETIVAKGNGDFNEATSYLKLINVSNTDNGRYQCIVTNSYGTTYSQKAKLNILIYPLFSKLPRDSRVVAGNTASLECSAKGLPMPQIAWQKDGGNDFPAARERRMHKMPSDDVLFIVDAKTIDSGLYSCIAKNPAGTITANATLTILQMPSFVKPMDDKEIISGGSIVLECMASGSPRPQLSWRKNGTPLDITDRHFFTAENQLLVIVNAIASDAGTYECELSNSLGNITGTSKLNVIPIPISIADDGQMPGVILITCVCCAVGTSIVWVIIIYQTRRRLYATNTPNLQAQTTPLQSNLEIQTHLCLDTNSDNSNDSGTGSSTNKSDDRLQTTFNNKLFTTNKLLTTAAEEDDGNPEQGIGPLLQYTNHDRHISMHNYCNT